MTEKRFQYIRGKYSHGVHDTVKDGEYKKGYRTTYDEFDLDKLTDELNIRENKIKQLEKENEQLKKVLGAILLEVKQDITNTNQTGEIKVFINPNSFELISEVLRKYGALKGWYE